MRTLPYLSSITSKSVSNDIGYFLAFPYFVPPGMSAANMKLVALRVPLQEGNTDENGRPRSPKQKLEEGEHIVRRVVELGKLRSELEGKQGRPATCLLHFHWLAQ